MLYKSKKMIGSLFLAGLFFMCGCSDSGKAKVIAGPYGLPLPSGGKLIKSLTKSHFEAYEYRHGLLSVNARRWYSNNITIGAPIGKWEWCKVSVFNNLGTTIYAYRHSDTRFGVEIVVKSGEVAFLIKKKPWHCG